MKNTKSESEKRKEMAMKNLTVVTEMTEEEVAIYFGISKDEVIANLNKVIFGQEVAR